MTKGIKSKQQKNSYCVKSGLKMCGAICLATEVLWGMRGEGGGLISHFWVSPRSGPTKRNFAKSAISVFFLSQSLFLLPTLFILFSEKTFFSTSLSANEIPKRKSVWIGSKVGFCFRFWLCKQVRSSNRKRTEEDCVFAKYRALR